MPNHSEMYLNIPVKDLKRSMDFFSYLGFTFNPQFTDDKAACMIVAEHINVMLLHEEFFKNFTQKEICDSTRYTEMLIAIDVDSREKVDEMVRKAVEAGGTKYSEPQDHGWMYYDCFADPDGHQWEIMYGDKSKIPQES
jgi:uncharacterized protein